MHYSTLSKLRDDFCDEGIQLCFNGSFSTGIIQELGKAVRQYLEDEKLRKGALIDVFSIFIEQAQNVQKYCNRPDLPKSTATNPSSAIIVIGKTEDHYWISSGNPVNKEHITPLIERLDELNGMSKDELKQCYKEQLRNTLPDDVETAGLGLIDIARRMSAPFQYTTVNLDDNYVFFTLSVTI